MPRSCPSVLALHRSRVIDAALLSAALLGGLLLGSFCSPSLLLAEETPANPTVVKHQITGLFSEDRVADLRAIFDEQTEIELIDVNFETAEATFKYDVAVAFRGIKPEDIVKRFNEMLGHWSRFTFGVKPLCTLSPDQLQQVKIPVIGHDCKGCNLVAYEAVFRVEGVERATASFREGLVIAWIDPTKTSTAALEKALREKQVKLPTDVAK